MNHEYLQDLHLLKSTFDPGNEAAAIANAIANCHPRGELRILDVGIGQGRATFQATDRLTSLGFSVQLTGIDLHISEQTQERAPQNTAFIKQDFNAFPVAKPFDAVIATQSLYYLGQREVALKKLVAHTSPTGCLLITVWTKNCLLYDLYTRFVDTSYDQYVTVEDLAVALDSLYAGAQIEVVRTVGTVDVRQWLRTKVICEAAFRILSRSDNCMISNDGPYEDFKRYLGTLPSQMKRENGTLIFRRSNQKGGS